MSLTLDDGRDVVLQPDSTWSFVVVQQSIFGTPPPPNDIFITLTDNRVLQLKTDYTWAFTRQQPPRSNRRTEFQPASATGVATNVALDGATSGASNDAYGKVATALRRLAPPTNHREAQAFLVACIKQEFKENEVDITFEQQPRGGWRAQAKIDIPAHRVSRIMECYELQLQ
jgi:hypothetical protein